MKTALPLAAAAIAASALLIPPTLKAAPGVAPTEASAKATSPSKYAEALGGKVTNAGFEDLVYNTTFFVEIPMVGRIGPEVSPDAVKSALRMAAENPHIHHVVYMIDSDAREGRLLDKEVVGIYQDELEVHGILDQATFLAAFPVFFCDSLFIVEGGHVGGLPLHRYVPQGSDEVTAKMVGIFTNQLASAAEQHGHNPDIVRAMIDQTKSLHYWREHGVTYVSNTPPDSPATVDDYEHITSHISGETITLDYDQAIQLELCLPIEEFDSIWVGDQIGVGNWQPANRYGLISNQIGRINEELTPLRDQLDAIDRQLPDIQTTRENRNDPNLRRLQEAKRNFERGVAAVESITEALNELYLIHPERHPYFPGKNGETILEDPDQWQQDANAAQQLVSRAESGLSTLRNIFDLLEADPAQLDDLVETLDGVKEHLNGIRQNGNVYYWEKIYEEPLPPDEYGVTYG
ncbi:MAG: hypothetical protein ACIAXF_04925 [Phycisphaerales bacterium JB063]